MLKCLILFIYKETFPKYRNERTFSLKSEIDIFNQWKLHRYPPHGKYICDPETHQNNNLKYLVFQYPFKVWKSLVYWWW